MKNRTLQAVFVFLLPVFITTTAFSELGAQDLQATLEKCISEGDSENLAKHFGESVDIGLPYADKDYGKTQAEMVMRNFFEKHPPNSFIIEESGSTSESNKFFIGEYISGEKKYMLLIMLRKSNEDFLIHKLKFEEKKSK